MFHQPYNRIQSGGRTVNDYLKELSNDDLSLLYGTSFQYGIRLPDLNKKLKSELLKRKMNAQPALF